MAQFDNSVEQKKGKEKQSADDSRDHTRRIEIWLLRPHQGEVLGPVLARRWNGTNGSISHGDAYVISAVSPSGPWKFPPTARSTWKHPWPCDSSGRRKKWRRNGPLFSVSFKVTGGGLGTFCKCELKKINELKINAQLAVMFSWSLISSTTECSVASEGVRVRELVQIFSHF